MRTSDNATKTLRNIVQTEGSVFVHGPSYVGKRNMVETVFSDTQPSVEYLIVTTREDFSSVRNRFSETLRTRLSIIECTTSKNTADFQTFGDSISNPGDLTGIGLEISSWVDELPEDTTPRVLLDSLSVIQMYRNEDTVTRFLGSLLPKVTSRGGTFYVISDEIYVGDISSQFDTVFEFREEDDTPEFRYADITMEEFSEWDDIETSNNPDTDITSLQELTTDIRNVGEQLRVYTNDTETVHILRGNMPETITVSQEAPTDANLGTAELCIRRTPVKSSDIDDLMASLSKDYTRMSVTTKPDIIKYLDNETVTMSNCKREDIIQSSRKIENRMIHRGQGVIHSGFQRFSRLKRDKDTFQIYQKLAANPDIEVHIYGVNDADLNDMDFVLHPLSEGAELAAYWFVASDYGATLVCEENADGETYTGFWLNNKSLAKNLIAYLNQKQYIH